MIKKASFNHGWWYYYRVHTEKLEQLIIPEGLKHYLLSLFSSCPHDYFSQAPRSSALRFEHAIPLQKLYFHEISQLAKLSEAYQQYRTAHSRVELYLLENDDKTIAVEVPLWLEHHELEAYETLFGTTAPLTGHIDLLRIEDEFIYIWDYKPNALKEKYAALQTMFYAYMLSKRTNLPLEYFRCGYFDEQVSFLFKPQVKHLQEVVRLQTLG